MNLREFGKALAKHLKAVEDPKLRCDRYAAGDTINGFYGTEIVNWDLVEKEIDEFCKTYEGKM